MTYDESGNNEEVPDSKAPEKVGFFSGPGNVNEPVTYVVNKGWALAEGDICLGTEEEMEKSSSPEAMEAAEVNAADDPSRDEELGQKFASGAIIGKKYRWPDCQMAYEIDDNLPNKTRVIDAMAHITQKTGFKFVKRTNQNNWVFFSDLGGCWSYIGMRGGKQNISLARGCSTGNTIHEILHAMGFYHEQSRNDRGNWVRIVYTNIPVNRQSNFNQYLSAGFDIGQYDYCSIMHYGRRAFAIDPSKDTIIPLKPGGGCIGNRTGLSPKDIDGILHLYKCRITVDPCARIAVAARRQYLWYRRTRNRRNLCAYWSLMYRYYLCKYRVTRNTMYLIKAKYFRLLYRYCRLVIVRPIPIVKPGPIVLPRPTVTPRDEDDGDEDEALDYGDEEDLDIVFGDGQADWDEDLDDLEEEIY